MEFKPAIGAKGLNYTMTISALDCAGCGNCAQICPAPKGKALIMKPIASQRANQPNFDYGVHHVATKANPMNTAIMISAALVMVRALVLTP